MVLLILLPLIEPSASYASANSIAYDTSNLTPPAQHGQSAPAQLVLDAANRGERASIGLREPRPTPEKSMTVLMMGVDAREGEPIDISVRPDSLFVVHINGNAGSCRTLSIPRDTRVLLPGYGLSKINHALAVGGIEYQALVVEQLLGIEIDHFGLLDFGGLVGLVDAVGGVTVENASAFDFGGATFPAGTLHLDGQRALLYSRFRGDAEADFGRQRRQQEVIRSLLDQAEDMNLTQALPHILEVIDGHVRTDLSLMDMLAVAGEYRSLCTSSTLASASLDGSIGNDWDDLEDMQLSFVHVSESEVAQKANWLTNDTLAFQTGPLTAADHDRRHGYAVR